MSDFREGEPSGGVDNTKVPKVENSSIATLKAEAQVAKLKNDIEKERKIDVAWLREVMTGLSEVPKEKKPLALSFILIGLNKMGISNYLMNGHILFSTGRQNFYKGLGFSNSGDTALFQTIFDGELRKGTFSLRDISEAMLYRTSMTSDYIKAQGKDNLKTSEYLVVLLKKYNIKLGEGETTYSGLKSFLGSMTIENYNKFYNDLNDKIDDIGDREFILASFNDMKFSKPSQIPENAIGNFAKVLSDKDAEALRTISKELTGDQKYALQISQRNDPEGALNDFKNNPLGFLSTINAETMLAGGVGALFIGIISALFGKSFFGGALAGFVLFAGGAAFGPSVIGKAMAGELGGDGKGNGGKDSGKTDKPQEKVNDIYRNFNGIVKSDAGALDVKKIDSAFLELTNNNRFSSLSAEGLSIFETENDFLKVQSYFKTNLGIDLTNENKDYYRHIFSKLKSAKSNLIGLPVAGETLGSYLNRTTREYKKEEDKTTPENISKNLDKKLDDFKQLVSSIEKNESWTGGKSREVKTEDAKKLAIMYSELRNLLSSYEVSPGADKNKVELIKLYLVKFYSGIGEGNDHNRNYMISIGLGLQMLPDAGKPKFPGHIELAQRVRGQTSISDYISKEVIKGRDIDEIFKDKEIASKIVEIRGELDSEYEKNLDKYLDGLNESSLNSNQKEALSVLKDIQGRGWFDMKESTKDSLSKVYGVAAGIGVGFGAGILSGIWTGPGSLVSGLIGAGAGAVAATGGTMLANKDDYSEDIILGLKELGINTAMFGAGVGSYALFGMLRGSAPFLSLKGLGLLGAEGGSEILLGGSFDKIRGKMDGVDISFGDAILNNWYWALMPLTIRGAGALSSGKALTYSGERLELAEQVVTQVKGAEFLDAMGDVNGAKRILINLQRRIGMVRMYDRETQDLLKPLMNNMDEIRGMKAGETKTIGEYKITLNDSGEYIIESISFLKLLSDNKGKNGVLYNIKGKDVAFDIDGSGNITRVVKHDGTEILGDDIKVFLGNFQKIPSDILISSMQAQLVIPALKDELKSLGIGKDLDVGGVKITKTERGYKIGSDEYTNIDEIFKEGILPFEDLIKYGLKKLPDEIKKRLSDLTIEIEGEKYVFYKADGSIKRIDGKVLRDVPPNFLEENFEIIYKKVHGVDVKETISLVESKFKNMSVKTFLEKIGKWSELKNDGKISSKIYNMTIGELLTIPRIYTQLWKHKEFWKDGNSGKIVRTLLFTDSESGWKEGIWRTFSRGGIIGGVTLLDTMFGDKYRPSALTSYYSGITTGIILDYLFLN